MRFTTEWCEAPVRLNCEALVTLAHAFLPRMIERGRGGVKAEAAV